MWNGSASQKFIPCRGIRQGDPLSPYIFVLCLERLSQIINKSVEDGRWKPFTVRRNGLKISHLCFADDMLLFAEASVDQMNKIHQCLDEFCAASGQRVSVAKTKIFFSKNVSSALAENISRNSGFMVTKDLGKYLGVPLLHQRITKQTYSYLLEKLQQKLTGWKAKNLSLARRITLCKAVLSTIPLYSMQVAVIPKHTCKEIEKICRRFIWGQQDGRDKIHLINWTRLCQPKEEGGLGIKKMKTMNKAFVMKLAWGIAQENNMWVRFLKEKYLKSNRRDDHPTATTRDSVLWKEICRVWHTVQQNTSWNLGNGKQILFWKDSWLASYGPLYRHIIGEIPVDTINYTVADMVDERGKWKWGEFAHLIPMPIVIGVAGHIPPT